MPSRRRFRGARNVVALLLALAALTGCGTQAAPPATPPAPLKILVVNDDGWNAPGVVVLRDALRRAGHQVVEIAPLADQRNAGTASTRAAGIVVRRPTRDPDVVAVTGTPADAVLLGVRSIFYPDLVVAGVSARRNVGVTAMQSGTVGAALTASGLNLPAIAVSTDVADPQRPRPEDFARSVDFTVRVVDTLSRQRPPGAPLMPQRTALNVNYPGGGKPPRGVTAAPTADEPAMIPTYRRVGRNFETYVPEFAPQEVPGGDNDATTLASGSVTLTDLSADPDRSAPPPRTAARLALTLRP